MHVQLVAKATSVALLDMFDFARLPAARYCDLKDGVPLCNAIAARNHYYGDSGVGAAATTEAGIT